MNPFLLIARLADNYYEILGVDPKCDRKALRSAYLKLCKEFHPDRNQGINDAKQKQLNKSKFQDINKAYTCLIKDDQRLAYDQFLSERRSAVQTPDPHIHPTANTRSTYGTQRSFYKSYEAEKETDFQEYYDNIRRRQFDEMRQRAYYHRKNSGGYDRYYGFETSVRLSNSQIVLFCLLVVLFGSALHTAHYSYTKNRLKRMEDKWKDNGHQYKQIQRESQ